MESLDCSFPERSRRIKERFFVRLCYSSFSFSVFLFFYFRKFLYFFPFFTCSFLLPFKSGLSSLPLKHSLLIQKQTHILSISSSSLQRSTQPISALSPFASFTKPSLFLILALRRQPNVTVHSA